MRYKSEILTPEESEALVKYLMEALRIRDLSNIPIAELKMLMNDILDAQQNTFEVDKKVELPELQIRNNEVFEMSFTSLCKIVINNWRINLDYQIKELKQIFIESDLNSDGILDLDEFTNLVENLEEI